MCDSTWLSVETREGFRRVLYIAWEVLGQETMGFHVVAASVAVDHANAKFGCACIYVVVHCACAANGTLCHACRFLASPFCPALGSLV